jgi:ParB family chromosome partitioning protein
VFELSLIENIQREDLNPMEEAQAYQRLLGEYGLTQEEVAAHVGKSRPGIANSLRLLNLDARVQALVAGGQLSAGHAKVLLGVSDAERQWKLAEKVCAEGLSVRQLEKLLKAPAKQPDKPQKPAWIYESVQTQMRDILGTKVNIVPGPRKSKIEIEYYSDEDLERLLDLFQDLKK